MGHGPAAWGRLPFPTVTTYARPVPIDEVLPLRNRYREETEGQIVHDSIHRRPGWTRAYLVERAGTTAGYGLMAVAGPWVEKPTLFEFYLLPEHRGAMFHLFAALVETSGARFIETQTNSGALATMMFVWSGDAASEKIVFHDRFATTHSANGVVLRRLTPEEEIRRAIEQRQGGGEWILESNGQEIARGGVLFHYNPPHGDVYMSVAKPWRRRGLGTYLVQELKRETRRLGQIPCARCSPENLASRHTLQRAGFVPWGHMLTGSIRTAEAEVTPAATPTPPPTVRS